MRSLAIYKLDKLSGPPTREHALVEGFDARTFLSSEMGTPEKVFAFLAAYNIRPPEREAVRKWFQRSALPGPWLALLLICLEIERGAPVSLFPYLKKDA